MPKDNHCIDGFTALRYTDVERCKYTHSQCLKKRGENLRENAKLMRGQERRNLEGLFSRTNPNRISVRTWGYNHQPFYNKNAEL
jgi:hypothetical protein